MSSFINKILCPLVIVVLCLASLSSQQQQQQQQQSLSVAAGRNRQSSKPKTEDSLNNKLKATTAATNSSSSSSIRERSAYGRLTDFVEDELPADFYEMPPEQLDLGMNATGRAPTPILNVVVLQNGQLIDSTVNVQPGAPLEMVIYLDDKSAKVYGLLVSYLKVKDDTVRQREEVIISNGCSIDTHIFGNFELNSEDQSLRAKFRAFKFPDSSYVKFVGTVNVCIKQCAETNCGGKRKRRHSIGSGPSRDDRLVFTVSTVLKIGNSKSELIRVR